VGNEIHLLVQTITNFIKGDVLGEFRPSFEIRIHPRDSHALCAYF
jgi:hypothetical protein